MPNTPVQTIEKQAAELSVQDHIKLIEALVRQLKEKTTGSGHGLDWMALYGLGKGLWKAQDAQDYVSGLRKDRE